MILQKIKNIFIKKAKKENINRSNIKRELKKYSKSQLITMICKMGEDLVYFKKGGFEADVEKWKKEVNILKIKLKKYEKEMTNGKRIQIPG